MSRLTHKEITDWLRETRPAALERLPPDPGADRVLARPPVPPARTPGLPPRGRRVGLGCEPAVPLGPNPLSIV